MRRLAPILLAAALALALVPASGSAQAPAAGASAKKAPKRVCRADGTGDVLGFDKLPAGGVQSKTLRLGSGSWRLFCALPQHAELGMTARLSVAAAQG